MYFSGAQESYDHNSTIPRKVNLRSILQVFVSLLWNVITFFCTICSGVSLQEEVQYLKKRAMSESVTEKELLDINLECTRINVQLELCLLRHNVTSLNLTLAESHGHVMRDVRDELSSGKLIQTDRLDELLEMLSAVRWVTTLTLWLVAGSFNKHNVT